MDDGKLLKVLHTDFCSLKRKQKVGIAKTFVEKRKSIKLPEMRRGKI